MRPSRLVGVQLVEVALQPASSETFANIELMSRELLSTTEPPSFMLHEALNKPATNVKTIENFMRSPKFGQMYCTPNRETKIGNRMHEKTRENLISRVEFFRLAVEERRLLLLCFLSNFLCGFLGGLLGRLLCRFLGCFLCCLLLRGNCCCCRFQSNLLSTIKN